MPESVHANDVSASHSTPDAASSHYDREGFDEEDSPGLSREVIDYDKQIPLIAEPGSDRRNHVPKHILDEVHEFLDDIGRPETVPPPDSGTAYEGQLRAERSARANARVEGPLNSRQPETARASYLDLDDSRNAREPYADRVSGPSFLGLGNSDYEYVYDDQQPSHWRRNFALLVLVALAVLAAVQWRSIRDMGLEYAKSGTIKVHVRKPGDQSQPNADQQSNASNNNGNGAPNLSVNPTRNADAENAKLRAEEEAAKGEQSGTQQNNAAQPNNTQPNAATATPPAIPPADTATTDNMDNPRSASNDSANKAQPNSTPTKAQPATRGGNSTPSAMATRANSSNDAGAIEEATPPPTRSVAVPRKSSARVPKPAASPALPGAFEMQQANILGQTPSAVPWLWSALGKGNPDAPVKLADMYLTGHGVEKSCDQGLVILRSAAARGNARASARLGTLYATGICVQQNRVQAYEWMGTAAGRSPSLSSWAEAYRQTLLQQMTPEERARVR